MGHVLNSQADTLGIKKFTIFSNFVLDCLPKTVIIHKDFKAEKDASINKIKAQT